METRGALAMMFDARTEAADYFLEVGAGFILSSIEHERAEGAGGSNRAPRGQLLFESHQCLTLYWRRTIAAPDRRPVRRRRVHGERSPRAEAVDRMVDDLELQKARRAATLERWGTQNHEQMKRLCKSFPTLQVADGLEPWDPIRFLRWLCTSGAVTTGSRLPGKFVCRVWHRAAPALRGVHARAIICW
jgi:hypothetical protein